MGDQQKLGGNGEKLRETNNPSNAGNAGNDAKSNENANSGLGQNTSTWSGCSADDTANQILGDIGPPNGSTRKWENIKASGRASQLIGGIDKTPDQFFHPRNGSS